MQEHKNDKTCTRSFVFRHVGRARLVSLDTLVSTCSTGSTGSTKSNVSSRVESSQVEFEPILFQQNLTLKKIPLPHRRYSLIYPARPAATDFGGFVHCGFVSKERRLRNTFNHSVVKKVHAVWKTPHRHNMAENYEGACRALSYVAVVCV